jgi:hypothetical protein
MQDDILSVAGQYDLTDAYSKINTMLDEATIEVQIVDAQKRSQLAVRDFKTQFKT